MSFLVTVVAVDDAVTLRTEDGRILRLSHLAPPEGMGAAKASAEWLSGNVLSRAIRVVTDLPALDRYGRIRVSRIEFSDTASEPAESSEIVEDLVRGGWLSVFPEPGASSARMMELLQAEDRARRQGLGHWESGVFDVAAAEPYVGGTDRLRIVLGRVRRSTRIGARLHLEFGNDWRRDFTVGLTGQARKTWAAAVGSDGETGEHRLIQVRGWVRWWNGPYMELSESTALQFID